MLWTIIAVLLLLWVVGMLVGSIGSIVHILLVVALVVLVLNLTVHRRKGGAEAHQSAAGGH